MTGWIIFGVIWIVCGFFAYGLSKNTLKRKYIVYRETVRHCRVLVNEVIKIGRDSNDLELVETLKIAASINQRHYSGVDEASCLFIGILGLFSLASILVNAFLWKLTGINLAFDLCFKMPRELCKSAP